MPVKRLQLMSNKSKGYSSVDGVSWKMVRLDERGDILMKRFGDWFLCVWGGVSF